MKPACSSKQIPCSPISREPDLTARLRMNPLPTIEHLGMTTALRHEFSEEEIRGKIRSLCDAEKFTPEGPVPDWTNRAKGLHLLLAYREGIPVARREHVPQNQTTREDMEHSMRTKPGYRHAVINYLRSLETQHEKELGSGDDSREVPD